MIRPNVEFTPDPIRLDRIPPEGWKLGLEYRTDLLGREQQSSIALSRYLFASPLALLLILGVALFEFCFRSWEVFALVLLLSLVFAWGGIRSGSDDEVSSDRLGQELRGALFWPALWVVGWLSTYAGPIILLVGAWVLAVLFADAVGCQRARWMCAGPLLTRAQSLAWRADGELDSFSLRATARRIQSSGQVGAVGEAWRRYAMSTVVVVVAFVGVTYVYSFGNHSSRAGAAALIGAGALLCIYTAASTASFRERFQLPVSAPFAETWRAIRSWVTYNEHEARAPGVYQVRDPFLSTAQRFSYLVFATMVLSIGVGGITKHFPFGVDHVTAGEWSALAARAADSDLLNVFWKLQGRSGTTSWVELSLVGAFSGDLTHIIGLLVSILLYFVSAPALLFAMLSAQLGHMLLIHRVALEQPGTELTAAQRKQFPWQSYRAQLTQSDDSWEQSLVWLGTSAASDYPILLERSILDEHTWILGDSGSGKTALGITPLVAQLLEPGDASVVVLDLKGDRGDLSLFEECRSSADKRGLRFRWVTNEPGLSSYVFNPLTQQHFTELGAMGQTEVLASALGLEHGEGYGKSYFSRESRRVLQRVFASGGDIRTFRDLVGALRPRNLEALGLATEDIRAARELTAVIESLSLVRPLNEEGDGAPAAARVQMHEPLSDPEVLYFSLPAATQGATSREVARLALFSLLSAAARAEQRSAKVYLVIDEFQRIATRSIDVVLQQARSLGIAVILANQAYSDLKTGDDDLAPVIQANTRVKLAFASSDRAQREDIAEMSGEAMYTLEATSHSTDTDTFSEREEIGPRLRKNDIIEASADATLCVAHIMRDHGVTAFGGFPFIMRVGFHIPEDEYKRRASRGWPPLDDETIDPARVNEDEPRQHTYNPILLD